MLTHDSQKQKDAELVVQFTQWYCRAKHKTAVKSPLEYGGVQEGTCGSRPLLLCDACATFARYARRRTMLCRQTPKPFCAFCEIKCYRHDMAEYSRKVMRYAGPRSLFSRYCFRAIQHAIGTMKYRC